MSAFGHRFRNVFYIICLLLVTLGLVAAQSRWPTMRFGVNGAFADSSRGLQSILVNYSCIVSDFFYRHFSDAASYGEVIRLRAELSKNRTAQILLVDAQLENSYLKKLLLVSERLEGPKPLLGRVIGRTGTPLSRVMRLNVGQKEGVARGDSVVSDTGVVGQVIVAGKYASDILLVADAASAIDVVVQRSRARGILRGKSDPGRYVMSVEDFDRLQDVQVGDVVVTSGIGAKFPEGVPVGQIVKVNKGNDGVYLKAEIKPFTDFSRLEHVLILLADKKERPWRMHEIFNLKPESSAQMSMVGNKVP